MFYVFLLSARCKSYREWLVRWPCRACCPAAARCWRWRGRACAGTCSAGARPTTPACTPPPSCPAPGSAAHSDPSCSSLSPSSESSDQSMQLFSNNTQLWLVCPACARVWPAYLSIIQFPFSPARLPAAPVPPKHICSPRSANKISIERQNW